MGRFCYVDTRTGALVKKVNCLNTKKRIFHFYAISFLLLLLGAIIWTISIAKLEPDITVSYLFKKNIVLNLLVCLFFASCKKVGVFAFIALFALSSFFLAFPIARSIEKKKVFPYNLIFIIFLGAYFFYSSAFFLLSGDIIETLKKDYSKIERFEFFWHEESKNNYSFALSPSNEIHVVSYEDKSLSDDDKLALVNGQTIIDAINKFYNDTKTYPDTLEQLVPAYLEEVPSTEYTGIWTSGKFRYAKDEENRYYTLKFYGFFEKWYWNNNKKFWEFEQD